MELRPITKKEDFVKNAGAKRTVLIRKPSVKSGADPDEGAVKMLLFGPWGSGKSRSILGLLRLGYRVFVLTTDLGGSGLGTVKIEARREGQADLLKNLHEIELESYEQVLDFIDNPLEYDPEFYNRDTDFLFWDGFSTFQQSDLMEYVGENARVGEGKEVGELRESGLQLETIDWNSVKNATVRSLKKFLRMNNKATGKVWHKIVTCQEGVRPKKRTSQNPSEATQYADERKPMLSGAGGVLSGAAFDLILETRVVTEKDDDGAVRRYVYVTEGSDLVYAKRRGYKLDAVLPGDMEALWKQIAEQAGLTLPGAV